MRHHQVLNAAIRPAEVEAAPLVAGLRGLARPASAAALRPGGSV